MTPYYDADGVTLWHGDARDLADEWNVAGVPAVMVTDPPYGRAWKQGRLSSWRQADDSHAGIAGDRGTGLRDFALDVWGPERLAVVFGDLMLAPPPGTRHVLVYRKAPNAGLRGAIGGVRRDAEAIYLIGPWPAGLGGRSSIIETREPSQGNPYSPAGRWHHPHAKPLDVMGHVLALCPPAATVVDPFAGAGSTLVAAMRLGRRAVGVEVEERHCVTAARRLAQRTLFAEEVTT